MDSAAQNVEELAEAAGKRVQWPKWALAMLFLANGAGFGTWATHVPVFKQFLHLENGSLTLVLTSFIVGAIVSMPVTGQLIARYGSRRITRIAAIGYVLMIGLLAQASSFSLFLIFAGLLGAANGALDIAMNANAVTIEKHYVRSSMCLFQGCWSAGGLLGAAAAGLLLKHKGTALTDLSLVAIVLGVCCVVALPMLVDDAARPSRSKFVWPDSALFRIAILAAFGLLAEGAIADWAPVYLHSNLGVTLPLAAAGYAAYAIAMTAARFSGDWLTRRFSGKKYLARKWPADSHRHSLHPPFSIPGGPPSSVWCLPEQASQTSFPSSLAWRVAILAWDPDLPSPPSLRSATSPFCQGHR